MRVGEGGGYIEDALFTVRGVTYAHSEQSCLDTENEIVESYGFLKGFLIEA